uniref:Uncharacterized protein n=1 Tax=Mycena chlorophos TaxID=658473 RepID=A0ABQ0KV01_MYCCL|nr:predicted protein [Mycena chlorophos]
MQRARHRSSAHPPPIPTRFAPRGVPRLYKNPPKPTAPSPHLSLPAILPLRQLNSTLSCAWTLICFHRPHYSGRRSK